MGGRGQELHVGMGVYIKRRKGKFSKSNLADIQSPFLALNLSGSTWTCASKIIDIDPRRPEAVETYLVARGKMLPNVEMHLYLL